MTLSRRAQAAALAIVIDQIIGEPPVPEEWHPVALFGRATSALEQRVYADRAGPGALYTLAGAALAGGAGLLLRSGTAGSYLTTSGRALHTTARWVGEAVDAGDLDLARERLPSLVGRDPDGLDAPDIARAVVESVAENTTDAIVAPALWTVVAGAPGAFLHRAADTLDSMVGYRNDEYENFGTPAARLDDILAWGPARVTPLLVALVRPSRAQAVLTTVRTDAPAHPSPNAGLSEAAFAAALDVQLGGTNVYAGVAEPRPLLGSGRPVRPEDIEAAVRLSRDVTLALAAVLGAVGLVGGLRRRRRPR